MHLHEGQAQAGRAGRHSSGAARPAGQTGIAQERLGRQVLSYAGRAGRQGRPAWLTSGIEDVTLPH